MSLYTKEFASDLLTNEIQRLDLQITSLQKKILMRKMGRTRSGGPRLCADRSGAETARGPVDLGLGTTEAERRCGAEIEP
ncbi:MAG: hypothetical protein K6G13_00145 [Agathobacter sp.]|uniref:hypothetical protein n=1 Tax=Agathobacter sp. TaxID=2021311 RepID=UPI002586454B|nr:hypothetical protein [Agathobacter sp.]MCR5676429.1 hypothetical protein [Agathobacter sp.]